MKCPHCDEAMEAHVHLFVQCPFARVFLFGSPIQLDLVLVKGVIFWIAGSSFVENIMIMWRVENYCGGLYVVFGEFGSVEIG